MRGFEQTLEQRALYSSLRFEQVLKPPCKSTACTMVHKRPIHLSPASSKFRFQVVQVKWCDNKALYTYNFRIIVFVFVHFNFPHNLIWIVGQNEGWTPQYCTI